MIRKLSMGMVLFFALSLVTGCAGIKDDTTRTKAEGAGTGAAIGAVAGAIIGQLAGGSTESTLLGAAIGGAVGGVGGYAYGTHVAKEKEKYAKEEDWLDACIAEAKKSNEQIVAYNAELDRQIGQLRQDTDALKAQYQEAETRKAKLLAKKKDADKLLAAANKELAAAKSGLEAQNSVLAQARESGKGDYAESLANQIEQLKANIKELEKRTDELASLSASMAV